MPSDTATDPESDSRQHPVETTAALTRKYEPTVTIVETVADATNTRTRDLPPLGKTIDTEAMNRLFGGRGDGPCPGGELSFRYAGYSVTVTETGVVRIEK